MRDVSHQLNPLARYALGELNKTVRGKLFTITKTVHCFKLLGNPKNLARSQSAMVGPCTGIVIRKLAVEFFPGHSKFAWILLVGEALFLIVESALEQNPS